MRRPRAAGKPAPPSNKPLNHRATEPYFIKRDKYDKPCSNKSSDGRPCLLIKSHSHSCEFGDREQPKVIRYPVRSMRSDVAQR